MPLQRCESEGAPLLHSASKRRTHQTFDAEEEKKNMNNGSERPNLFDYATSELSQDAFLAWLLANASKHFAGTNVHRCGVRLLNLMAQRCRVERFDGTEAITVRRQHKNMDIYARIKRRDGDADKDDVVLVIEDKAGAYVHGDQLERYKQTLVDEGASPENAMLIYCQTYNQSQLSQIKSVGYEIVTRHDLLEILKDCDDEVVGEFLTHLKGIDELTNSWRTSSMYDNQDRDSWDWLAWQGFYMEIQRVFPDAEWAYVPNPSGGFLGLWWHWREIEGGNAYLQLEQTRACFKVEVTDVDHRQELKFDWNERILNSASTLGMDSVVRPRVMRVGNYMTVAVLNNDYRSVKSDGLIDINETVHNLKQMECVLENAIKN